MDCAISSGRPTRLVCTLWSRSLSYKPSPRLARPRRCIGVSMNPGHTRLTRIPCGANSAETDEVSPINPCFEATYAEPMQREPSFGSIRRSSGRGRVGRANGSEECVPCDRYRRQSGPLLGAREQGRNPESARPGIYNVDRHKRRVRCRSAAREVRWQLATVCPRASPVAT
jgi:hypothetical protein